MYKFDKKTKMRIAFLVISILCSVQLFAQKTFDSKKYGTLKFTVLYYGITKGFGGQDDQMAGTPTGTHRWLDDLDLIKKTDSIPMELKQSFGLIYQVEAKDTFDMDVDIEWIYPKKITNEKGEEFKSIRYTSKRPTNIPSGSNYSLNAPYEMVKGKWTVNIYIDDKKMTSKTFIVY
jgi:hypothetical protein